MLNRTLTFAAILSASLAAHAQCPVNSIVVKGHVEHLPRNASVRVELVYPPDPRASRRRGGDFDQNGPRGEAAEAILDGNKFTIPVEFVTNNRRTLMSFGSRCDRKPESVVITLKENDRVNEKGEERDRVTLDFPHDFKSDEASRYTLRTELVLDGEKP